MIWSCVCLVGALWQLSCGYNSLDLRESTPECVRVLGQVSSGIAAIALLSRVNAGDCSDSWQFEPVMH